MHDEAVSAGLNGSTLWLATGRNWPDALTAGPAVAALGDRFLLVDGQDLNGSPAVRDALTAHRGDIDHVRLVGGRHAISDAVAADVEQLLQAAPAG